MPIARGYIAASVRGVITLVALLIVLQPANTNAFEREGQRVAPSDRDATIEAASLDSAASADEAPSSHQIPGYPLFRNYVPDDYGPDLPSQNWAITQDDRGIIYVGNPAGVLSYDGANWRLIPTDDRTLVRTVFRGTDGRIYVGAYGEVGYLAPDAAGQMQFVSLEGEIPPLLRDFGHTASGVSVSNGVYFQTRNAIYRWDGEEMDVWTTSDGSRFFRVFAVRDTVYVSRESVGLHRIVDERLEPVPGGTAFSGTSVTAILPYGNDDLLIGTVDSKLYLRRNGEIERFPTEIDRFLTANELYTAAALPDGSYAFATLWGGVVITDPAGRTRRILDKRAGLIGDDVRALFVDQQDGLWMAYESGIARAEITLPISMFDDRTGLDGVAMSIVRHDDALHVGTTSGVFRLSRQETDDGSLRPVFQRVSSLRAQAFSLLSHRSGLLAATDRGVFLLADGQARSVAESQTAYGLHASRHTDGLVYVGYIDGVGTMQYQSGQWKSQSSIPGLDRGIFFLEEDARGDLWAASAYGGLWNVSTSDGLQNQPMVTEIASEGQHPQHVFRMAYVPNEGLHIVSRSGVTRPVRDEMGHISLEPDTSIASRLPSSAGRVLSLTAAPDGDLWVTAESDTYWLDREDESETSLRMPFAYMPEFNAYASLAESAGRFWVVGEEGVVSHCPVDVPRKDNAVRTLIRSVSLIRTDSVLFGGTEPLDIEPMSRVGSVGLTGARPGLSDDEQQTGLVSDAKLDLPSLEEVPGGEGASPKMGMLASVKPTRSTQTPAVGDSDLQTQPEQLAPGTSETIKSVVDEETDGGSDRSLTQIPYSDNAVRVEFAAPGYGHEESVEYQYRLDGFDADWSAWTSETKKEYTNLPPGRYQFDVRARNPRVWTASTARFAFEVLPPWYRTIWAYAAYAFLMGGLVFGVVQWRSAQLERRAMALERVIERRTAEVKEQARQLEVYNTELVRSNEVLQETVEEKSKLLGVAAHDLKNPLFGIRALSEVLLERDNVDETARRKLDLIRSSADDTLKLINDLLASAASSAQVQAEMEMIDAAALAEWVTHSFQHQADRKQQRLTAAVPSEPCIVEADKRKLREAMNNLISNAIKYSPHGAPILVRVERQGDEICFCVEDEGPGLGAEDQQRLFAPFQRLTPEPTGDEGSSGLGLYIVKQIAELHDGDVEVDSELGKGSTFKLIIPAASAGPRRSHNGQSVES
ncbi:hypothetical protein CRI94_06130 [Longibacter salinarum]|uniref:histidine kinase n=1 Tax=Longibacter salinarum TaxID=1850348 RepID=A0A2A8D1A9_9BACT|nr:sensor histidine kinase [Longibacter salinarum]PEN14597.1 hypothetical protein CRI94_06130 [Longibacter salinarum]